VPSFASADEQLPAFLSARLHGWTADRCQAIFRRRDNLEIWNVQQGRIQPASDLQLHQLQYAGRTSTIVSGQSETVLDATFTEGAAGLLTTLTVAHSAAGTWQNTGLHSRTAADCRRFSPAETRRSASQALCPRTC
jgi:hypothetical protein